MISKIICVKWHMSEFPYQDAQSLFVSALKSNAFPSRSRLPQLKDRIDEYRMKRFELQHMEDETLLFEKTDEFLKEYETFRDNPVVSEFLASEAAFCQMMRELYTVITESIEFDMDFE